MNHPIPDSASDLVLVRRDGAVMHLSLNRPDARNALNTPMRRALAAALHQAEVDPQVRAVLVTGEGRHFCAGADIRELRTRTMLEAGWAPARLDTVVESLSKPVVGALHGYVLGGGLELALAFTIRLASEDFRGGFPEVKLGIFPALGGTQRLPRLVGEGRALELTLRGRIVDAQEALRIGLVTEVVATDKLREQGMAIAQELAAGPPVAMRAIMECVRRAGDLGRADGLDYERRLFGIVCGTADKTEGVEAWLEKRPPRFAGK
ncbi:MAG: enoyl-CoA hydratase/isomerase family protein [Pigmentiphaga sp.]|uniref:enoyl-CoA hydratase/isomerase family protein n=1 Tax=Pigmentiphaga sp. TaxID=1977564 RepID=UPI0029AE48A9|nr:enoyl-CoA hydratase/isomerase family protein [Pigmentiphaga sp.]MDX3906598.1 enoyl-CoA hydratase/isomerase family protein [Pigmentiphaga sp.]